MPPTPSQSNGREYFPPVPSGGAATSALASNTNEPAAGETTKSAGAQMTMVLLLTFADLRIARTSDESLQMLGHHPMQLASKSLSELLHRTDRPKLAVLREWLRWVVCTASGLPEAHLARFPGNVTYGSSKRLAESYYH
jgi:hypothetical protein